MPDQDLIMCAETFNEISQWVLSGKSPREIGLKAFCILKCVSRPSIPLTGLFQHLETRRAQRLAKYGLRTIYSVIAYGDNLEFCGRKALAALWSIRPDHVGGCSLEQLGEKAKCAKQNLSKHQIRFRAAISAGKGKLKRKRAA
jgi:hypothetical protein